jgi:hypothetical protein
VTSDKKVRANRENGQKTTGPTSQEGKEWSRRNALKSGLFSKELVVAAAGEKQGDYDALLSLLQDQFPPQDFLAAFLVEDTAKLMFRLQRPSRYESAEIRKQCNLARARRSLEKIAEVGSLKARFIRDYSALCTTAPRSADRLAFSLSLENTRRQLEQTSMGLEFLLWQIEDVQKLVERDGYLSFQIQELLVNACGIGDQQIANAVLLNGTAKAEMEKFKKDEEGDRTTFEHNKRLFSESLKSKMETMRAMKKLVENLESEEEGDYLATLVMPPAEALEKIHRVEAPLRRHFHQNLHALLKVFYGID